MVWVLTAEIVKMTLMQNEQLNYFLKNAKYETDQLKAKSTDSFAKYTDTDAKQTINDAQPTAMH